MNHRNGQQYAKRREGQRSILMHRVVKEATPGDPGIDHINGDGLDNRRANLRRATTSQNCANRGKQHGTYSSRYTGVCWAKDRDRWRAYIRVNKTLRGLGHFEDEDAAARAYNAAATKFFGEFALLNVIGSHPR